MSSAGPTVLPAFIRLQYDGAGAIDAIQGDMDNVARVTRTKLGSAFDDVARDANRLFDTAFKDLDRQLSAALARPRNATGSLDLGTNDLRQAVQAQEARAAAAQEAATAIRAAAAAEGDYSQRARTTIAAAEALAVQERNAATAAREQAEAVEQVQRVLDRQASTTNSVIGVNKRLAGANDNVRFAAMGATQQLQDIAISLYSGQRAGTVFAQQLPQLAFALTSLEGSTNKTADKIGKFATFMSGPWGLAIGLGVGVLATLITGMITAGDEADAAKKKSLSLGDALKQVGDMSKEATKAIDDYNDAQGKARDNAEAMIKVHLASAEARLKDAIAAREQLQVQLELAEQQARSAPVSGGQFGAIGSLTGSAYRVHLATTAVDANKEQLDRLGQAARNLRIQDARRDAEASIDPLKKINNQYDDMRDKAIAAAAGNDALAKSLKSTLTQIEKQRKAAQDAQRASTSSANQQFGKEVDLAAAKSIAAGAGFRVTSGLRTKAEQQHLYDTVRTPENPVALPGTSAHEKGNALDIAFGPGVSIAAIRKAYADEGVKLTKVLKETGHFHIEWSTAGADKAVREADAIAKKQQELKQFGDNAADAIANINSRFDEQPRLIDAAAIATRQLESIITDLRTKLSDKNITPDLSAQFKKEIADAEKAKQTVQEGLLKPFKDLTRDSERRLQIQSLLAKGREDEAVGLQAVWQLEDRIGTVDETRAKVTTLIADGRMEEAKNLQALLDKMPDMIRRTAEGAEAEARKTRELARQKALLDAQLSVIDQAKTSLTNLLSGKKTNLLGDLKSSLKDLQGHMLFDSLFGDAFAAIDDKLRQRTPLGKATAGLEIGVNSATASITKLAEASEMAAGRILAAAQTDPSTVDGNPITVTPAKTAAAKPTGPQSIELALKSAQQLANLTAHGMVDPLLSGFDQILGTKFFMGLSGTIAGALGGAMTGGTTGGIIGGLKGLVDSKGIFGGAGGGLSAGLGQAQTGAAIGTISSGIMKSLGIGNSTTGSQIGGAIGSFGGPVGSLVGSIAGGLLGGLFKKKPHGTAVITSATQDAAIFGNKGSARDAAGTLAGSVQQGLISLADQLGATLGNFAVSIGTYKDSYRVNVNGTSGKLGGYSGSASENEKKYGLYDFGSDSEAAIKFAISNAVKDGALLGLRKSTAALLQSGKDIDAQTQKALTWENAFKELKSYTDPVGAALDTLNTQFKNLIDISKEAGASTEEYAQLQQLYAIKQAEVIQQTKQKVIGSLQDMYDSLTVGDSGLSLRVREANALATYNPLKDRVAAGDKTAYDDYSKAAQTLLDIERQIYGSQQGYFDRFNEIMDLTKTRIDAETNITSIAKDSASPFDAAGQVNTSIQTQTDVLSSHLDALNTNVGAGNATLKEIRAALQGGGLNFGALARLGFTGSY